MTGYNMIKLKIIILIIFFCYPLYNNVEAMSVKVTNLVCISVDKAFSEFQKCRLKALARDKINVQVHIKLYQLPIDNITINGAYFIRGSNQRYQPFLYNTTTDFCKFLKNTNSFPFWKIMYSILTPYTNLNHTCPYDHDIFVDNLILNPSMFKMIPFPTGEYMIVLRVFTYYIYRGEVRVYFMIKE